MKRSWNRVLFGLLVFGVACMLAADSSAQKKGKSRPLTTSQMMAGLIKPKYVTLQERLEKGPKTDDEWKAVAIDAALLNESGYMMMDDHRCPDKIWENAATLMRTSTEKMLAQIDKQDAKGAVESLSLIRQSCKDCHNEHKYAKKAE